MNRNQMKQPLFSRDFTLMAAGQIISLFGNAVLRFALPLYLLNQTGSSALYGLTAACALLPAILLLPVGGIIADRVNKRNVMVVLDFFTALLTAGTALLLDTGNTAVVVTAAMMILYGVAGAYQPSVQASVPVLAAPEQLAAANAVINTVSSLSSLLGPALGGILYSAFGLYSVLSVCAACFLASAVMELFIRIPFEKQEHRGTVFSTVKEDLSESIHFIWKKNRIIGRVLAAACGLNLFLSAMITVGLPYFVTVVLELPAAQASRFYGLAEGILAVGGLAGGICAGIFSEKLNMKNAGYLLIGCSFAVFPTGIFLALCPSPLFCYIALLACCFCVTVFSAAFSVEVMSFVQAKTPEHLTGKVVSVMCMVSMCAQPLGSVVYGVLFQMWEGGEWAVVCLSGILSLFLAAGTNRIFRETEGG